MTDARRGGVAVVGAGPAGMRAAQALAKAGLRPVVIDEGDRAGGQIYRRPPAGFVRPPEQLYGSEARKARTLHAEFDALVEAGGLDYRPRSSVVAIAEGGLHVLSERGVDAVPYERLILSTGASDRVAPVPGWQAPGVYTLGAAQIALKAQAVALGRQMVLAGSGPLLTLVAVQLQKAGADVAVVLDTAPMTVQRKAAMGLSARPALALRGFAMRAKLGSLYHAGVVLDRIEGDRAGVSAICWRDAKARARRTECDTVALGWHLRSETHLADLAGCRFDYDDLWAQWLPRADRLGRACPGVYLAGDGLRPLGADGAEVTGRLAAAACLADMGLPGPSIGKDLRRLGRIERFSVGIARAFRWPAEMVGALPDSTIVCRCESVTAAAIRETVSYGGGEANRVKSMCRAGMGRCQGRYCQLAATELIAAKAGCHPREAGRLRTQPPVRPSPVAAYLKEG